MLVVGDLTLDEDSHEVTRGGDADPADRHRVRAAALPHAQPQAGAVQGADPRPRLELRLRRPGQRRRALHLLPAQEDRRRPRADDPHHARRRVCPQAGRAERLDAAPASELGRRPRRTTASRSACAPPLGHARLVDAAEQARRVDARPLLRRQRPHRRRAPCCSCARSSIGQVDQTLLDSHQPDPSHRPATARTRRSGRPGSPRLPQRPTGRSPREAYARARIRAAGRTTAQRRRPRRRSRRRPRPQPDDHPRSADLGTYRVMARPRPSRSPDRPPYPAVVVVGLPLAKQHATIVNTGLAVTGWRAARAGRRRHRRDVARAPQPAPARPRSPRPRRRVAQPPPGRGQGRRSPSGSRRRTPTRAPRSVRSAPRSTRCSTTSTTPSTRASRARNGCASSSPTPATSCAPRSPRSAGYAELTRREPEPVPPRRHATRSAASSPRRSA